MRRVVKQLNDNVSRVNERLTPYTYRLQHGVEREVEKPVGYRVTQAMATRCIDANTGQQAGPVTSLQVRELDGGTTLGITAYYDLKHTEPYMQRRSSTNLSVPNLAAAPYTTVTFDQLLASSGTAISYSAGVWTFNEPGRYHIHFNYRWEPGVTNWTDHEIWYQSPGGVQVNAGYTQALQPSSSKDVIGQFVATPRIPPTDIDGTLNKFEIKAYQANATAVARLLLGTAGGAIYSHIIVQRLYNESTPTYDVSMLLLD